MDEAGDEKNEFEVGVLRELKEESGANGLPEMMHIINSKQVFTLKIEYRHAWLLSDSKSNWEAKPEAKYANLAYALR